MTYTTSKSAHRQGGVAAVELALLLPVFLLLLILPLYFGRVFWHYTVAQNAAQDAARYLSTVPRSDMRDPSKVAAFSAVATAIVTAETAELNPGNYAPLVTLQCNGAGCSGFTLPSTVTVNIQLLVDDIFFPNEAERSIAVTANVTFPYVGR